MSHVSNEIEEVCRIKDDNIKKVNHVKDKIEENVSYLKDEIGKNMSYRKDETEVSEKAGKHTVVSETIKVGTSQEAFELYYIKKTIIVSKETPDIKKTQADKTGKDFNVISMEASEEGKVFVSVAADNSPELKKDIVERSAFSFDDLKDVFEVDGFYIGIPYSM